MSVVRNPEGHPQTLVPPPSGNLRAAKHGVYSEPLREPRAQEIFEAIMEAPHVSPLDAIGAAQIARRDAMEASFGSVLIAPTAR